MTQLRSASFLFLFSMLAAVLVVSCDSGGVETGGGGEEPEPASVQFSAEGATVSEGDSTATITVEIADAGDAGVSVDVVFDEEESEASAADVEDYSTQTVSFPAGTADGTTRDVTVSLTDDEEPESTETATFTLQNATNDAETGTPGAFDLDIEDNDEGEDEDFTPVEVRALDCPAELESGEDSTFTATINEDATTPVSSAWDFGDDTEAAGLTATKSYDAAGTYDVTFTASNEDSDGNERSDNASCTIEVIEPAAPAMIASVNSSPNPSSMGESVSLTADVEGDTPITCEWDFDDGGTASECDASHTYDAAGRYDVTLTASNDAGSDTATLTHEVEAANPNVLFVDTDATGAGDGSSWANAFPNLHGALNAADAGKEIWVAEGTYYPDQGQTSGDRSATFQLESDVALYGGFAGSESSRDARNTNPESNGTVLSGDIGNADFPNDNSYHVVTGSGVNRGAVLNGFTITAGRADDYNDEQGAGMLNIDGSPTVQNVIFAGNMASNHGGGMYNMQSSPRLENILFENNEAGQNGGGMNNFDNSSPALTNVTFVENSASGDGGGMRNGGSSTPVLTDVLFEGNNAGDDGGGILNVDNSNAVLISVDFFDNSAESAGGGMISFDSSPSVVNAVFNGNSADSGGGVYNEGQNDSPRFANVVFSGNTASNDGGGMYNDDAYPSLIDVTFSGNTASDDGGAMFIYSVRDDTPVVIRNSIFWGNTASGSGNQMYLYSSSEALLIAHSLVQGGVPEDAVNGGNNLDDNPRFIDANGADNLIGTPDDNARLQSGSPAINVGDNEALPADEQDLDGDGNTTERLPLDLDGEARVQGGTVDLGAYEGGN